VNDSQALSAVSPTSRRRRPRCATLCDMPLDAGIQQMLAMLESMDNPSLASGTPEEARKAFRMLTVELRAPETVVPVAAVEDSQIPGPAGQLQARVYRPEASGPVPTILFIHGGGFVIGDIDTHDNQCRTLCREVGAVVLSVGYRLAPESPFAAAVADCVAALTWTAAHAGELGGDPDRLAIAGDSAGGNLAAVTARLARDAGGPPLAAQLLVYPGTDFREDDARYPSREQNATGYFLTREDMQWFSDHYMGTGDPNDPSLSPILAEDLAGLPPAVLVTAEYDPLRDEGEAYARALEEAGVPVIFMRYDGLIHGFFDLTAFSPGAAEAVRETSANLRQLLS
jgi:acetyl esterase